MAFGGYDDSWLHLLDDFSSLHLGHRATPRGSASSIAHSKEGLELLYEKAKSYVAIRRGTMRLCTDMYRDKARSYFDDITLNKGGIMTVYKKDYHGDPKSPSNGRINGLFFSVNLDKMSGGLPLRSIYGEKRLVIPITRIFEICPNVYFTDFYCVRKNTHYVTLVMTKSGSTADTFCKEYLIPFNIEDNPFFKKATSMFGNPSFRITDALWVEILVTEDIDINDEITRGAHWSVTLMTGKRSGGSTGLKKNALCPYCNI